ncbi:Uncharacterized protein dnm_060650 [Desulfonema magnum]|uniref:Nitroreductase domain-containing protein n=1 Tax=Desulfonema magnum TaxID=45655 RepID=A0A975BR27_9BACT|nr:Uncharacterized protein dnm_060650 [Desulfonema magnum]
MKYAGTLGLSFIALPAYGFPSVSELINLIKGRFFMKPVKIPTDSERTVPELPREGPGIPVETALNSRCTSDYNEAPEIFHWGMFDKNRKLSPEQISQVREFIKIPRFTPHHLDVRIRENILTFIIDNRVSGIDRDWLMVESGMQQQTAGLICSALGIGMVFKNLGKDGTRMSETEHSTVNIRVDAMKPTYSGRFWITSPPVGNKPWLKGTFPDPDRKGSKPLIPALSSLTIHHKSAKALTAHSLGQLLWAARGRTPHLYKSRAWGMTIPTWGGEQNISGVYLILNGKIFRYVNWRKNRPTHSLEEIGQTEKELNEQLKKHFPSDDTFIVLGRNETFGRSLWEVGYQMMNILLQAYASDIAYEAILLDESRKAVFRDIGIKAPVAAVALGRNKWKPDKL